MRRLNRVTALFAGLAAAAATFPPDPVPAAARPEVLTSPPGQVVVVTVNARQRRVLDPQRFGRLYELVQALRTRPAAFDGGPAGAVHAPDVISVQEMPEDNAPVFRRMLNQAFGIGRYRLLPEDQDAHPHLRVKLLYDTHSLELTDGPHIWTDVCLDGVPEGESVREYQWATFAEAATGALVTVAAVHLKPRYRESGEEACREANVAELRNRVEQAPGAVVLTGDFNKRAVEVPLQCDPAESSAPLAWYASLTAPASGRAYADAARRGLSGSMADQWTHEQKAVRVACDGSTRVRRTRIDYVFASGARVAAAGADHPGWAGSEPGTPGIHPRYSDHRWVHARLVVSGPPRAGRPVARPDRGGRIRLAWPAVEGAVSYAVYRARGRRAFRRVATVPASPAPAFTDRGDHGVRYRWAVAALGPDGGQGAESRAVTAVPDARGPRVVRVSPRDGATGVPRRVRVRVRFDEPVASSSVDGDTLRLYAGDRRVAARVVAKRPRVLELVPRRRLRPATTHRLVVSPVRDRLGNRGTGLRARFRTAP